METPLEILEISEMIVGEGRGADFLDTSLLMWIAQYNTYGSMIDAKLDHDKPRKVRLRIAIYVDELDNEGGK